MTTKESLIEIMDITDNSGSDDDVMRDALNAASRIVTEALMHVKTQLEANNTSGFELGKLMLIDDVDIGRIATTDDYAISIPEHHLVTKPGLYAPRQARVFRTGVYMVDGEIVNYDFLRKLPDFHGTSNYDSIVLVEVYEDRGMDGWTDYRFIGYRAVETSKFVLDRDAHQGGRDLPACMRLSNMYDD